MHEITLFQRKSKFAIDSHSSILRSMVPDVTGSPSSISIAIWWIL